MQISYLYYLVKTKKPKMKKHYILHSLLSFLAIIIFSQGGLAQIKVYEEGSYIKVELKEEDKDEIMAATTKIINKYAQVATFRDDNNNFSDQSYAEFVGLFAGSAEVYDDLAKKNGGNINYATYADKVFQYLQGTGVKFELNNTYLDEITYDSSGFYKIQVSFEKIMFNGLNEDNELVNFPNNGKPVELTMTIEVPEYDLSQATILNILGEAKKIKTESASMISVDFNYHLGNVSKTESEIAPGFSSSLPVGYNSYGVDVIYRRSLNSKKSLYLLAGASLGFHNFSSDLSSFEGGGKSLVSALVGPSDTPDPFAVPANISTFDSPDNSLSESLTAIDVQVPIGVSLRVVEKYNWDIFVDIAVVPTFIISSSGRYGGQTKFIKIPESKDWDDSFEEELLKRLAEGNEIPEYIGVQDGFDNELAQVANNFSAAAQISPVLHYKFNFRMALEAGFNVSYGFLPYFQNETNHLGSEPSQLLNITEVTGAENPSILQNNYKNVSILRYGARIGIVFRL